MADSNKIMGVVLNPGTAAGQVLRLEEPLSFWGGYDPSTGKIIDQHHPQAGLSVRDKILVLPSSRGSAGTPAGVAESLRTAQGPVAIVIGSTDVNISIGAMVAEKLYSIATPVIAITNSEIALLHTEQHVSVDVDGVIHL